MADFNFNSDQPQQATAEQIASRKLHKLSGANRSMSGKPGGQKRRLTQHLQDRSATPQQSQNTSNGLFGGGIQPGGSGHVFGFAPPAGAPALPSLATLPTLPTPARHREEATDEDGRASQGSGKRVLYGYAEVDSDLEKRYMEGEDLTQKTVRNDGDNVNFFGDMPPEVARLAQLASGQPSFSAGLVAPAQTTTVSAMASFGTANTTSAPNPFQLNTPSPAFGSAPTPAASSSMASFGSTATAPPASGTFNNFGSTNNPFNNPFANTNAPTPASSGGLFGASTTAPTTQPFLFGATTPASGPSAPFVFGATSNSFGGTTTAPTTAPATPSVFNNFSQASAAPTAPTPARTSMFDVNGNNNTMGANTLAPASTPLFSLGGNITGPTHTPASSTMANPSTASFAPTPGFANFNAPKANSGVNPAAPTATSAPSSRPSFWMNPSAPRLPSPFKWDTPSSASQQAQLPPFSNSQESNAQQLPQNLFGQAQQQQTFLGQAQPQQGINTQQPAQSLFRMPQQQQEAQQGGIHSHQSFTAQFAQMSQQRNIQAQQGGHQPQQNFFPQASQNPQQNTTETSSAQPQQNFIPPQETAQPQQETAQPQQETAQPQQAPSSLISSVNQGTIPNQTQPNVFEGVKPQQTYFQKPNEPSSQKRKIYKGKSIISQITDAMIQAYLPGGLDDVEKQQFYAQFRIRQLNTIMAQKMREDHDGASLLAYYHRERTLIEEPLQIGQKRKRSSNEDKENENPNTSTTQNLTKKVKFDLSTFAPPQSASGPTPSATAASHLSTSTPMGAKSPFAPTAQPTFTFTQSPSKRHHDGVEDQENQDRSKRIRNSEDGTAQPLFFNGNIQLNGEQSPSVSQPTKKILPKGGLFDRIPHDANGKPIKAIPTEEKAVSPQTGKKRVADSELDQTSEPSGLGGALRDNLRQSNGAITSESNTSNKLRDIIGSSKKILPLKTAATPRAAPKSAFAQNPFGSLAQAQTPVMAAPAASSSLFSNKATAFTPAGPTSQVSTPQATSMTPSSKTAFGASTFQAASTPASTSMFSNNAAASSNAAPAEKPTIPGAFVFKSTTNVTSTEKTASPGGFVFKPSAPTSAVTAPSFGNVNAMAEFQAKAKEEEEKREKKLLQNAMDEDMDSDEDRDEFEAKWRVKRAEEKRSFEEAAKKASQTVKPPTFNLSNGFTFKPSNTSDAPSGFALKPSGALDASNSAATPTFKPAIKQTSDSVFSSLNASRASSPGVFGNNTKSVFDASKLGSAATSNIFGHVSDASSANDGGASNDDDSDEVDENLENIDPKHAGGHFPKQPESRGIFSDGPPPYNTPPKPAKKVLGRGGLFDRIPHDENGKPIKMITDDNGTPETPAEENLQPFSKTPSTVLFGMKLPSDQTWKHESPIRFGEASGKSAPAPTFNFTAATPTKEHSTPSAFQSTTPGLFGQMKASTPLFTGMNASVTSSPGIFSGLNNTGTPSSGMFSNSNTAKPTSGLFGNSNSKATSGEVTSSPAPTSNLFGNSADYHTAASGYTPSFSFGHSNPASVTPSFSFGNPNGTLGSGFNPSVGFVFGGNKPLLAAASAAGSGLTSRATTPGGTTADESGQEDPEAQQDEQVDLTINAAGEEDEDNIFEVKAAVRKHVPKESDPSQKEFVKTGAGKLKVLVNRRHRTARVVVRLENGQLLLNKSLMPMAAYTLIGRHIMFPAAGDPPNPFDSYMFQVKTEASAKELADHLDAEKVKIMVGDSQEDYESERDEDDYEGRDEGNEEDREDQYEDQYEEDGEDEEDDDSEEE